MSDKRSTLSKLKKSFRIPIRLRRNRHEEAIDALEGPLPPFLQAPPPRADVQVLQKEWQFKERRTELIEHLDSLYEKAYEFDKPLVDPTAYNKLKIRCETLDLGDDGECENGIDVPNFFVPFPLETLMEHRIVTPDEETKRDYEAHEDIFDRTKNGFESRAPYFRLIWHFECFRRSGIPDGPGRLIDITVWRKHSAYSEFMQEYFEPGVCFQPSHRPAAWWTAKTTSLPHLMCILDHRSKGSDEVFRGEILTILATTITRFELECFQDEVVIPSLMNDCSWCRVLMFSVMSDSKARIIQAYFNGDKLVIRKSRLYDFSTPETLSSSTTLFMQWMASKTGGNTSGFPLEDFEPFEEDDDTELFGKKEIEKISDAP
ncbi:hypothetical protein KXV22_005630 [Aspergillus fumigatus]|nr:hypothetical protein KXX14_003012 [Aspergillus fumigatus]KAH1511540.1 hypothetical protein KXX06_006066 [Aspergillus fumigatus]KAH1699469.1 hypothetical protein KXX23_008515 [Aspergillus fumigatus]KAH1725771.1 hypothetical protein KXX60_006569 [Aspergillus fumigatus]KAH1743652.1 hypothetical protein KXX09_009373 [Aspergillus fumigatus]